MSRGEGVAPLRICVIGAGRMGSLHAQKVAALGAAGEGLVLSGVVDADPARARVLGERLGCPSDDEVGSVLAASDAAVVAVPTRQHVERVSEALKRGLDVLVEKPIAATLAEAEALLATARSAGRILQVGHLERFNAALRRVADSIRMPRFVEAHRLGPFPARATDVDVVLDLMIHDLDILGSLVGAEPERIEAIGVPVLTDKVDIANARLRYPGGCVANVTASRVSPNPMRKIRIFQPDAYFSIDFLEQSVALFTRREGEIRAETLEMDGEDALADQLRSFVAAVRTRGMPAVSGEDALRALRTATRVRDAMPPLGEGS